MSDAFVEPTSRITEQHELLTDRLCNALSADVYWYEHGRAQAGDRDTRPAGITVTVPVDQRPSAPSTAQIRRVAGIFQRYYGDVYISPEGIGLPDVAQPKKVKYSEGERWAFTLPTERFVYRQIIEVVGTDANRIQEFVDNMVDENSGYHFNAQILTDDKPPSITSASADITRRANIVDLLATPKPERVV